MKKLMTLTLLIALIALPFALFVGTVGAVDPAPVCSENAKLGQTSVCKSVTGAVGSQNAFVRSITAVIKILSYVVGIAAIIGVVVSGLRLVLSNGDSAGVASARQGLIYALVGIVIVAFAQAIVAFVLNRL